MKAIVLSAGQGKRLLPLTADSPKCLLQVAGDATVLELQLRADGPDGRVERRADGNTTGLARGGGFVRFDFEPLADSAGRAFFFRFSCSPGAGQFCRAACRAASRFRVVRRRGSR